MKRILYQKIFSFRLKLIAFKNITIVKASCATAVVLVLMLNMVLDIPLNIGNVFASPGHDGGHANEEAISGASSEFPVVTVEKSKSADQFDQTVEASGELLPYQESDVFALREGIVQDLYVNVGDVVKKGQVLGYLYADVEQTILNAELNLAQAEKNAAQKRREFLETLPESQIAQIESSMEFAQEAVNLAKKTQSKSLSQLETTEVVTQKEIESLKVQQKSQLAQLEVQIETAKQRLSQQQLSAINGISDVISSIEGLLFTNAGVITSNAYPDTYNRRRLSVYTQDSPLHSKIETETRSFYRDFLEFQNQSTEEEGNNLELTNSLLNRALDLSKDARILSNKAVSFGESDQEVADLKAGVDESIDHLVELSDGVIDSLSEIKLAESEKLQLSSGLEQDLVRLNGEISKLGQEKERSQVEQESAVSEKLSSVKDLEKQLDIFSKGVEQRFLEGDLDIVIKNAQVNSIRQKIGAGRAIVAPFGGTISRRYVNEGDSVNLEKPVYQLVNDTTKFVRFFVSEADLVFIEKGLQISLASTAASSLQAKADIVRISPSLDKATRTVLVEADLIKSDITDKMLAYMNVRVQIPVSTDPALRVIPESALLLSDGQSLWIVNQDVEAERNEVKVRFIHNGFAYLETDLENQWIVTKSPVDLEEGLAVDTTQ